VNIFNGSTAGVTQRPPAAKPHLPEVGDATGRRLVFGHIGSRTVNLPGLGTQKTTGATLII